MKKLIAGLMACLLLAGCSDAYASISNPNEKVFSVAGNSLTRGELYSFMQANDAGYSAINMVMQHIVNSKVEVTEEMTQAVEETMTMYESLLGDSLESYLISMGYASVEAFEADLLMNEQAAAMTAQYIEANFETLCRTYGPRKVNIATFTDKTMAEKARAAASEGTDFEEACKSFETTSTSFDPIIFTTQSSYPTNVIYAVSTLTDGQVSELISNDDATTYYVVKMIASNPEDFKDEAVSAVASISTISSDAMMAAFKEAGFEIFDKNLYDIIAANYPDYLPQ